MRLPTFRTLLLLAPALAAMARGAMTTTSEAAPECTASAHSGYFDLRPDIAVAPGDGSKRAMTTDYRANGWDTGYNFTMNICGSVVKPVEDVVGVDEEAWGNVAGYYTYDGSTYSIG